MSQIHGYTFQTQMKRRVKWATKCVLQLKCEIFMQEGCAQVNICPRVVGRQHLLFPAENVLLKATVSRPDASNIPIVVSRVHGCKTSMVQGRDARLIATDDKRSRRSGAVSDKPNKERNTANSPRRAGNAYKQQREALLRQYIMNAKITWEKQTKAGDNRCGRHKKKGIKGYENHRKATYGHNKKQRGTIGPKRNIVTDSKGAVRQINKD